METKLKFRVRNNSRILYGFILDDGVELYNFSTKIKVPRKNFNERKQRFTGHYVQYNALIEGYEGIFNNYRNYSMSTIKQKLQQYRKSFSAPTRNDILNKYDGVPCINYLKKLTSKPTNARSINSKTLINYYDFLKYETDLKQNTILNYTKKLYSILKQEYSSMSFEKPKFDRVDKRNNHLDVYLNKSDIKKIKEYTPPDKDRIYYNIILLIYYSTLRYSDIKKLRLSQISGDTLNVFISKTKRYIKIPLSPEIKQIIYNLPDVIPSSSYFNKRLRKILMNAKVDDDVDVLIDGNTKTIKKYEIISSTSLRRSRITNLLRDNYTYMQIRALTGHTNDYTLKKYDKTNTEDNYNILNETVNLSI